MSIHAPRAEPIKLVDTDADLDRRLLPVARRIFTETFARHYDPGPFTAFCDAVYGTDGTMARALADKDNQWRLAVHGRDPVGYVKLAPLSAPAPAPRACALEMQQLYVLPEWHGAGIAQRLADWAIERATMAGAPELYLTVFDHNERAKRFYARNGFYEVGRCTFRLGDRIDDDRIWRKDL